MINLKDEVIAVDICNTLADVCKELDKRLGQNLNPSLYFHQGLWDKPNFFKENLDIFSEAEVISNSVEILNELAKYNTIYYITARPKISEFVTKLWLKKHGYPIAKVYFTNNKVEIANKLGVNIAIEDAPFELEKYIESGIEIFTHKKQYNINFPNRFNWEDINIRRMIKDKMI